MNNKILGLLFMTPYIVVVLGTLAFMCKQFGWRKFLFVFIMLAICIALGLSFGYGITLLAK